MNHDIFFHQAYLLAEKAGQLGEVPVGAVLVYNEMVIAEGFNCSIGKHAPHGHAEMMALEQGGKVQHNYRLLDCDLYVTLEPCLMCYGAMVHARIRNCYYAAADPKSGVVSTGMIDSCSPFLNHRVALNCSKGIYSDKSSALMRAFFKARR